MFPSFNLLLTFALLIAQPLNSQAITLNCQYSVHTTNYGPLMRPYQCKAVNQPVTGLVNIESVSGNHESGKSNDDVKVLNIQAIKSAQIPSGFENSFKNLEGLFAFSSEKTILTSDDLKPFTKLKYFDISFNRLVNLPSDLFESNPQLEWIDFSDNRLKLIGLNILDSLTKLHYANFATNICINEHGNDKTDIERNIKRLLRRNCQPFEGPYYGTTPRSANKLYPTLPVTPVETTTQAVEETTKKGFFKKIFG